MPTYGQIALLMASIACFAFGGLLSLARLWRNTHPMRLAGKSLLYWGACAAAGVLFWHSIERRSWNPIGDNFDALIWLAVLLALLAGYVQRTRPLAALDWFIMPVVVALLICAAVIGRTEYRSYVGRAWTYLHYTASFTGAAFFAIAAASGLMYVIAARRLRSKQSAAYLGSLERLEHLTMMTVTLGFALLTFGIITGAILMVHNARPTSPWKIALAASVWVVYAVVLHAPINPIFRGRRAAVLSVLGFLLMIGTLIAVQFGSTGGK